MENEDEEEMKNLLLYFDSWLRPWLEIWIGIYFLQVAPLPLPRFVHLWPNPQAFVWA